MPQSLKIVIPMAGWGTRMRPHTWSKPKPLVSVAGKASLDHLLESFESLPESFNTEYIFIVGPYLGETQIPAYIAARYPQITARYILQAEMKGQSHAIYLTKKHLQGPLIMVFSDTLIETDFSFLSTEKADLIAWVKPVPDPRRFGVAVTNSEGKITQLIEKPSSKENDLALVGCYYFRQGEALIAAIEEQFQRNLRLKNEYFLADAINIMLEKGLNARTETVGYWLDTGTIEATLKTNARLLEIKGGAKPSKSTGTTVTPPVAVHPSAKIKNAHIGPNVSIGANCEISDSKISNSIIEAETKIRASVLTQSLIGKQARVEGCGKEKNPASLNVGDNASVICKSNSSAAK